MNRRHQQLVRWVDKLEVGRKLSVYTSHNFVPRGEVIGFAKDGIVLMDGDGGVYWVDPDHIVSIRYDPSSLPPPEQDE